MTAAAALTLENVTVAYGRQPAVEGLSGSFEPGSLTGIVGPNGAGKSTLMRAVMGEVRLSAGRIGRPGGRTADIGYLPQAADLERRFPLTVADAVALGAWRQTGMFGALSPSGEAAAKAALAAVGLDGAGRRPIAELSAGQFQRVLFARLILQDAALILLDEPFSATDAATTRDLLAIIAGWHRGGRTVVAVVHDIEQVRAHFPQTLLLARRAVAWGPTREALSPEALRAARMLMEGWSDAPAAPAAASRAA